MRRHSDGCLWILLLASYLLVLLVLARPMGMCLARMVNDILLPGSPASSASRGAWPGSAPKRWAGCSICWRSCCLTPSAARRCCPADARGVLPFNPQHLPGLSWDLALNTAISFVSNTNWQAYAGESTMSYLSQMVGLTVQNFLSAATGIAVVFALTRAFARQKMSTLGNARVDLTPPCGCCCRSLCWWPCSLFSRACRRICRPTSPLPPSKGCTSCCRWGLSPHRKRLSCWALTAAVSSMPTPPIRLKTRPR